MQERIKIPEPRLVVSQRCHEIVRDLVKPNLTIYFTDFLITYSLSLLSFLVLTTTTDSFVAIISGSLAGLGIYRCSVFIHEIQHQSAKDLASFALIWNLAFGIPCFMPTFLYGEHFAHHSVQSYGTQYDSEYIRLTSRRLLKVTTIVALGFVYPLLGPLRFAVFTPLSIVCPHLNKPIYTRLSSLYNIKTGYRRPWNSAAQSNSRWFQELSCFLWAWMWISLGLSGLVTTDFFLKIYLVFSIWMVINQLRTIAAHKYQSDGLAGDNSFQLQDTNTFDRGWTTSLWAPVGLRYHALHHLLPSLPYHNLETAHRRIICALPADSPYNQTIKKSLLHALWQPLSCSKDIYR